MVPTGVYDSFLVLKYLLGAKHGGAHLFHSEVHTMQQTEHTHDTPRLDLERFLPESFFIFLSSNRYPIRTCPCWAIYYIDYGRES